MTTPKQAILAQLSDRMEALQRMADKAIQAYVEQHDNRELARYNDCISRRKALREAYDIVYWGL